MEIELKEVGYKVAPYSTGLCYEIFRWQEGGRTITKGRYKGNKTVEGWKSIGRYPSTVEQALNHIFDLCLNENPAVCASLAEAVSEIKLVRASLECLSYPQKDVDAA